MAETIQKIMDRIKNLNEFIITKDIPEGFRFNGTVPFDIKIKDNQATFKVYALDINEADKKIVNYLEQNTEE